MGLRGLPLLGALHLVSEFGVLDRLCVGEGVRSILLDVEEHAEAGPLCRWDYFGEVGVLAVDVMPADLDGVSYDRLPELCEWRVEGGLPDEDGALSVDARECGVPPSDGVAEKGA